MAIVDLSAILQHVKGLFTVDSGSDVLALTSDEGSADIDVPDGTYTGSQLATALQTAMNADATLTGGTITFAVSYTASTAKFTLDATTGHTIAFTLSGSDAATSFGFIKDHAADQTITSDQPVPGAPDSEIISDIHTDVEKLIKEETGHDWESTSYVEFKSGAGTTTLLLDHYPVGTITEISTVGSGIKIKNTSTDSRNAYVAIDSDSLDLTVVGGTSAMSESEAFSDYATLTAIVDRINAVGSGWEAALYDSDYASYPTSCLMEVKNVRCGAWDGVAPEWSYLQILTKPYSGYVCDDEIGEVYLADGWPKGYRNIVAKYAAYASDQEDIQYAVKQSVKFLVDRREKDTDGIKSYRTGDLSVQYALSEGTGEGVLPSTVVDIIKLHSKVI